MPSHMGRITTYLCMLLAAGAVGASSASADWNQVVGGPNPINHAKDESNQNAFNPSIAPIADVPWVAWNEFDGSGISQVRVSRLNASATAWEEVGGSLNRVSTQNAYNPSLISFGGVPYVAWEERVGAVTSQIWVARLNASGTGWEIVGGPGPLATDGFGPTLAVVDGALHIAFFRNGSTVVHRLNASGTAWQSRGVASITRPGSLQFDDATLASIDGEPYVAWIADEGSSRQVIVTRLNRATNAWEEVAPAQSPINHSPNGSASHPHLAAIGGVPHVAWTELEGSRREIRVSRLNAGATPAWEEIGAGESPINHSEGQEAFNPILTDIGGVPYVAWVEIEQDDDNRELRVARLGTDGKTWHQVVGGPSPINNASNREAGFPSLTSFGGVPYVAWSEPDSTDYEIRVSRLEPEFLSQSVMTSQGEALLLSRVRTYGVAYPVATQYGRGTTLTQRTATVPTAHDVHEDTWFQSIGGLTPGADYSARPVGFDGTRVTAAGPTTSFTTQPTPGSGPPGPAGPAGPAGPPGQPNLLIAVLQPKQTAIAGRGVTVRFIATADANVTLEVRRCGSRTVVARNAAATRAGRGKIKWNGRIGRSRPAPGCYILALRAVSSDGQVATDRAKLRLTRRGAR